MPKLPKSTLAQLEKLLISEIPGAIRDAHLAEPVYCARIWYNGTDSEEDAVPWVMLVKDSVRQKFIKKQGEEHAPYYIWGADEITDPDQSFQVHLASDRLRTLYSTWYQYLCDVDDDDELQHFREMIQQVSKSLNELDWKSFAPVTDDFVVAPADGSHTFCDDLGDLLASVTPRQLELLQSRKLIPSADLEFDDDDDDDDHVGKSPFGDVDDELSFEDDEDWDDEDE
ncbi:MAG: hypothetical protein JSS49_02005 [Planctomycetes bacterium]|nr:hypothetical protein [Planctomycetota bacterium]